MARRRRDNTDWAFHIAKFVGLLVAAGFVYARLGNRNFALGFWLVVVVLILGLFVIAGLVILRLTRPRRDFASFDPERLPKWSAVTTAPARVGAKDLVEQLRALDWFQFEKVVALLYKKLGYQVTRRGGANADGGIDLVLDLAGERSAVQCKQWKTWNVGVKSVREFLGALTDSGINRGIFVTLCGYTADAKQLADKHGIKILNDARLVELLEQTNARFDPDFIAALKDPRKFCPKCEKEMVLRTAMRGAGAGQKFWGCSSYPRVQFHNAAVTWLTIANPLERTIVVQSLDR
jgi:hypothetical protein